MFTWFISTKKMASARSRSTPSSLVQLRAGFACSAEFTALIVHRRARGSNTKRRIGAEKALG